MRAACMHAYFLVVPNMYRPHLQETIKVAQSSMVRARARARVLGF